MTESSSTNATPSRKAAVLLAQLDAVAAAALLERLPPPQAEELRARVVSLDHIDAVEKTAVVGEFLAAELFQSLRPRRQGLSHPGAVRPGGHPAEGEKFAAPFAFLHETPPEDLAYGLSDEPAAVAALVIRHLPPVQAAAVLARLAAPLQAQAIACLANPQSPRDGELDELEQRLKDRLAADSSGGEGGLTSLAEILRAASPYEQEVLRESLALFAPDLAQRLTHEPQRRAIDAQPTFDDVLRLPDDRLSRLFYEADPDVAILALAGGPVSLVERVCSELPAREARLMQRAVENLGPVRLGDIDAARQEMARLLRRIDESSPLGETQARRLAVMV